MKSFVLAALLCLVWAAGTARAQFDDDNASVSWDANYPQIARDSHGTAYGLAAQGSYYLGDQFWTPDYVVVTFTNVNDPNDYGSCYGVVGGLNPDGTGVWTACLTSSNLLNGTLPKSGQAYKAKVVFYYWNADLDFQWFAGPTPGTQSVEGLW